MNANIKPDFKQMLDESALAGANTEYVESLYESYLDDPASVGLQWRLYFDDLQQQASAEKGEGATRVLPEPRLSQVRARFKQLAKAERTAGSIPVAVSEDARQHEKQVKVLQLINAFRFMGHLAANTNPLESKPAAMIPELRLEKHDLSVEDLDTVFNTGSLVCKQRATLKEILEILCETYCGSIGAEYMHITNTTEKRWIQSYLESQKGVPVFEMAVKTRILNKVAAAEGLERFLHTKYLGQKRFSLEGAETLIPMLDDLIQRVGRHGGREVAIGMAHRGRLNVLVNVMGKTPAELFMEFEGKKSGQFPSQFNGSGDVKYHLGFSSDINTEGGVVHVALAFNPSHLEIVAPVVEGSVRARQDRSNDTQGNKVIPVVIHGDAAFAGQGVVMETFNMSQSRGFSTKGTVHIVINNQIGFTTSNQNDARSTLYCTDVAKMVSAPIFHVNGDDPEAALFVMRMALDYRMKFKKDVVIDLVCYRRHGHSEADEPMATQPLMYQAIRKKPTTLALYAHKLVDQVVMTDEEIKAFADAYRNKLAQGICVVDEVVEKHKSKYPFVEDWSPYVTLSCSTSVKTSVELPVLQSLCERLHRLPVNFKLHPNVERIIEQRKKMIAGEIPVDWGFAENMAYATLLNDGYAVRISGQDVGRGTFFHRHATLHNQVDGEVYVPLRHLAPDQPRFLIVNSLLSEEAVLAFEYGYATTDPKSLTVWEAQFGDFANNAQVVIDQFIVAGEQKWNRMCGLVMLLPHGYEGQGPEHSSARLERYLQLCAQQNIQVCVPTTAAQIFHLLRRQMLMNCRKPLVVMSPKSLLRHKHANSTLEELTGGKFEKVIGSTVHQEDSEVERLILCAGKVYYDLCDKQQREGIKNVAIVRIEQLYPFPLEQLQQEISRYSQAKTFVWCQEEPMNQGAWYSSQHHLRHAVGEHRQLDYAGRPRSAAPAVGLPSLHKRQLEVFLNQAFGLSV